jgi:ferredoxin
MTAQESPRPPAPGLKVRAHPGLCEGWGNCHRWAPEVYPLDDEGRIAIHLLAVPDELAAAAWAGAQVCPARAITVDGPRPAASTRGGCGP